MSLDAQTALLEDNRDVAQARFETMLENPDTRLLGLRGLHVEAERQGEAEAAAHYAEKAMELAPDAPWAGNALLRHQSQGGDWQGALKTLESSRWNNRLDKKENNRLKAVLQTAEAMSLEDSAPEDARKLALSAHKLAPSLVPATVIAARISSRLGDIRKASKILETTWKLEPHPEIADAYVHVRSGDAAVDRLKRARMLASKRENHVEGRFAIAGAAIDATDWQTAREALSSILRSNPTERACLLMADIEEAEHGDKGRMRDWLSRAVRAPRDPAWTADGYVSEQWAPISPISGKLDAFEWKVPVELLEGPGENIDYSDLALEPLEIEPLETKPVEEKPEIAKQELIAATTTATALAGSEANSDGDNSGDITAQEDAPSQTSADITEPANEQTDVTIDEDATGKAPPNGAVPVGDPANDQPEPDDSEKQSLPIADEAAGNADSKKSDDVTELEAPVMPDDPGISDQ